MNKITIRLPENVRERLRDYADEEGLTYTEAILEIIPEDADEVELGEGRWMDLGSPAHERLDEKTGEGVDYGYVIDHFLREINE